MIVLHYQWTEDGASRGEIYGPWEVTEGEAYLEQVAAFMAAWPGLSGAEPDLVTMALVVDPGDWLRQRAGQAMANGAELHEARSLMGLPPFPEG